MHEQVYQLLSSYIQEFMHTLHSFSKEEEEAEAASAHGSDETTTTADRLSPLSSRLITISALFDIDEPVIRCISGDVAHIHALLRFFASALRRCISAFPSSLSTDTTTPPSSSSSSSAQGTKLGLHGTHDTSSEGKSGDAAESSIDEDSKDKAGDGDDDEDEDRHKARLLLVNRIAYQAVESCESALKVLLLLLNRLGTRLVDVYTAPPSSSDVTAGRGHGFGQLVHDISRSSLRILASMDAVRDLIGPAALTLCSFLRLSLEAPSGVRCICCGYHYQRTNQLVLH